MALSFARRPEIRSLAQESVEDSIKGWFPNHRIQTNVPRQRRTILSVKSGETIREIGSLTPASARLVLRASAVRCLRFKLMAALKAIRYSQVKNWASPLKRSSDWKALRKAS